MRSTCPEFRKMKIEKSTNIFQNVDRIPILSSDFRCHPSPIAAVPEGPEGLCARKSQTVRQSVQVLGVKNGRNLGRSTFLHFVRFEKNENMIFEKVDLKNRVLVETKTFRHCQSPVPPEWVPEVTETNTGAQCLRLLPQWITSTTPLSSHL